MAKDDDQTAKTDDTFSSPVGNERQFITENPGTKITTVLFNGENYLSWSQSAALWLYSRSKFDYVDGTIKTPSKDDPSYKKWHADNALVMSWLVHSMEIAIANFYLSMATARDI